MTHQRISLKIKEVLPSAQALKLSNAPQPA